MARRGKSDIAQRPLRQALLFERGKEIMNKIIDFLMFTRVIKSADIIR